MAHAAARPDPSETNTSRPGESVGGTVRTPDPLIGRVIADRYRIVGHVGRGGMGVVYKVEHLRIGKLMAMKLLTGELSRNRDVVRRFKREALAASRLTSVNTVQVWDFGHSDGLTYLVMELVAGEDLGRILKREGPMPFWRVAQIAVQVCNSMMEAHERGIVHRDIKPENILILHPGGNEANEAPTPSAGAQHLHDLVKVLDFGLAKLHDDERPHTNDVTTTGAIVGTPYYMSPEQIRGEAVDGRADIYALGAVMYRAITGHPPFSAPTPMGVLTQHLTEPLIPPHDRAPELAIPKEASDIITKAMAKERDERYESARALREALIGYLATLGVSGGFLRTGALEAIAAAGAAEPALERLRPSRDLGVDRAVPATRTEIREWDRKRRRLATAGVLAAMAGVGAMILAYASLRGGRNTAVTHQEAEPNDTIATANPITLGTPTSGHIGKRLAPDRPDVDHWVFDVPSTDASPLLEIGLTPLPNMALCVELHRDPSGNAPLGVFCRPRSSRLEVAAFRVQPGRHWLRVTQDRTTPEPGGALPPVYENVSDTYALRVAIATRAPDLEIEPNATPAEAQDLTVGQLVRARIAFQGDRDVFCATGSGRAQFVVVDRRAKTPASRLEVQLLVDAVAKGSAIANGNEHRTPTFDLGARTCVSIAAQGGGSLDEEYEVSLQAP